MQQPTREQCNLLSEMLKRVFQVDSCDITFYCNGSMSCVMIEIEEKNDDDPIAVRSDG